MWPRGGTGRIARWFARNLDRMAAVRVDAQARLARSAGRCAGRERPAHAWDAGQVSLAHTGLYSVQSWFQSGLWYDIALAVGGLVEVYLPRSRVPEVPVQTHTSGDCQGDEQRRHCGGARRGGCGGGRRGSSRRAALTTRIPGTQNRQRKDRCKV